MSAARNLDDKREFDRWFIVQPIGQPEQILFFSNVVASPEEEKLSGEMVATNNFVIENNLYVPNSQDLEKLDSVLELGRLDGFELHYRK